MFVNKPFAFRFSARRCCLSRVVDILFYFCNTPAFTYENEFVFCKSNPHELFKPPSKPPKTFTTIKEAMKHPIQNKKTEKKTVTKMQTMKIYNTLAEGENQKVTSFLW